jgi:hypothetical protein
MGDAGPCSPLPAEFGSTSNDAQPREVTALVTGFGVCICATRSPSRYAMLDFTHAGYHGTCM